ncbi:MAG: hybrid sensor histidine kinase/response regulator [Bdellovibrio sp.]
MSKLTQTLLKKVRQFLLWIPVLSLILGSIISVNIYQRMHQRELIEQRSDSIKRSKEIIQSLDLLLSNSILRIQSYEEYIGSRTNDYKRDSALLGQSLRYTIFQRFSIFKIVNGKKNEFVNLHVLSRFTLPNSPLPEAKGRYVTSEEVLSATKELIKNKEYSRAILHEYLGMPLITYALKSRGQSDVIFFFTAPLVSIFEKIDLKSTEYIDIEDISSGRTWKVASKGVAKTISLNQDGTAQIDSSTVLQTLKLGEPQKTGLRVHFHFSPSENAAGIPPSMVTGLMSLLIAFIVSYLFWVLVSQNKKVSRMIIEKTHDLEKSQQDLQEALLTKTRFLGSISHEIRTPLNLIMGMIDLCEEKDVQGKIKDYLSSMRSSGNHLLSMIEDLLDLAKAETNELQVQPKRMNLINFLSEVARISGQDCAKKNLRLYTHLAGDLPATVNCDPSRLRQILLNLLRNACKYTNSGHIILRASVLNQLTPELITLRFEVEDTGVGIQQDKIQKVFEAFFQVENSYALAEGGVGLGLAIVKELVKKLNGRITVQSEPNKGSVFQVDIDMEVVDESLWSDLYRSGNDIVRELILVSSDSLLVQSVAPLNLHPSVIFRHFTNYTDLSVNQKKSQDPNKWFLLDTLNQRFSAVEIDHLHHLGNVILLGNREQILTQNPGLDAPILSTSPLLFTDILGTAGFSSRTYRRENKEIRSAPVKNAPAGIPDSLTMLVADDDMGNQELYQAYFEGKSWQISYTSNGGEAYDDYVQRPAEVVILDVRMPIMDGFEVAKKIREYEETHRLPRRPILLVTADALEETMEKAKEIPSVKFLTKPIRKSLLLESIAEALR